jgi:hypothetical protein
MNKKPKIIFAFLSLLLTMSLACGAFSAAPTDSAPVDSAEAEPTNTPQPTDIPPTATKKTTNTPRPTNTPVPPTATAAPVGVTVSNEKYEVRVVKVRKLGSVYINDYTVWQANPGYLFLELGVKVVNKTGSPIRITYGDIYTIEKNGDIYAPGWGGYKDSPTGTEINPASIIFEEIKNSSKAVTLNDLTFLRLIWVVADNNPSIVLFGFDTAPLIEVMID